MCLILKGYLERAIWTYKYKSIVKGCKEKEAIIALIFQI
jgi:hypothetical protein